MKDLRYKKKYYPTFICGENSTNSLVKAIQWLTEGSVVEVSFRDKVVGNLHVVGEIDDYDEIYDINSKDYGAVYRVLSDHTYYICLPDELLADI